MKQRAGVSLIVLQRAVSLLVLLFFAATSPGQSPTAVVNGQVRDASGAAIAGATVEVFNDATHVRYSTETNDEGIYSIPSLPAGTYHMQVSKQGFKTVIHPDITLNIQDARAIGFSLPVGAISDTVTVEGGVSLVNTENAAVSTVVDQTYIQNMPLNGRSFQDLILLTPGTVTQTPQYEQIGLGQTGEFSVNGQRTESNYYTVDGVSANVGSPLGGNVSFAGATSGSVAASTALGTTQALVSVDALQEFRVQSSTYSAEYGRNPGGQIAFETKSGTNQWHGSAYDYFRNGYVDAQDWFNDYFALPEPAIRQNDFGGTLGGPAWIPGLYNGKDKTFFFASYEGLRLAAPQPASANYVPDLCMRGKGPCPSYVDSNGNTVQRAPAGSGLLPVVNAFPLPSPQGLEDVPSGFGQFIGSWSNPSSIDATSVRLDHVVNDKLRLFFRFADTTSSSATRESILQFGSPSARDSTAHTLRTYTAGVSSVFSSRFSNQVRLNYSSNDVVFSTVIDAFSGSTPIDLVKLSGLASGGTAGVSLVYGPNGGFVLNQFHTAGRQKQWNFVDNVALWLGRHQLKFGVDYRRLAPFASPGSPNYQYLYFDEPSVESNSSSAIPVAQAPVYPLYRNFSAFLQDEWRASRRVSVSMGLRWDVNPPPGVTQGVMPYTVQGTGPTNWSVAPQGTPLWQTSWFNFAPRLGAACILRDASGWETIVRGGGGVFFDSGQQLGTAGFNGPGFLAINFLPSPFPGSLATPTITNPPATPYNATPRGFATHLQLPYTLEWNASIQQGLGKDQAFTVSYVGSHAARLLQLKQISAPNNPNSQTFIFIENGLTSDYNSLQLQFQRRLSRGLTALASYTWSHCFDYASQTAFAGFGFQRFQRGNCDFDVRHNVSAAFSYDLPNVGHGGIANALVHHWGLDDRFTARTAFPVTLAGPGLLDSTGQIYNAGLDFVPNQPIYLYGADCASVLQTLGDLTPGQGCPGGRAINPNAFTNVSSGFSNVPRNFIRGFGAWQMDLAVRRDFPIRERLKLQFRAEAFNTFNHPNFGRIDPTLGSPTFGQATGTLASTLGVLNPLYQMGGPRSLQFALKLAF